MQCDQSCARTSSFVSRAQSGIGNPVENDDPMDSEGKMRTAMGTSRRIGKGMEREGGKKGRGGRKEGGKVGEGQDERIYQPSCHSSMHTIHKVRPSYFCVRESWFTLSYFQCCRPHNLPTLPSICSDSFPIPYTVDSS